MRGRRDRTRSGRDVNGILLLDKPPGLTSNAALQQAKRAFKAKKAGHTGSLDPIATGLLPLCFGEATKVSSFFLGADKRYRSVFTLGSATDTGDSEGQETFSGSTDVSDEAIEAALDEFRGEIEQVPPMYSAVKFQGQPLYKLARQGIEVERKPRLVTVLDVSFERLDESRVQVDLHCTSGFYVRSLAHELGERLGCGAHVSSLSRTGVAEFYTGRCHPARATDAGRQYRKKLDQLLIAMDVGLKHLPGITLSDDAAYYLCRGQPVKAAELPNEGWVRLYADEVGFLGLGEVLDGGRVAPKRLFNSPQG